MHGYMARVVCAVVAGVGLLAVAGQAQDKPAGEKANADVKAVEQVKDPDTGRMYDAKKLPYIIRDESSTNWVVDNFAGNNTAGTEFYIGPANEVGGMSPGAWCEGRPDGYVYIGGSKEVAPDGTLQVVRWEDGWGPGIFWDEKEQAKYTIGNNCIRKLTRKPDGKWVSEVVAGTPGKPGAAWKNDGAGTNALISSEVRGSHRTAKGTFYWMEPYAIRKFENGTISTLNLKFIDLPEGFQLIMQGKMLPGEDDDSLLVADGWNFVARRVDLKTMEVRNIAFMPNISNAAAKQKYADEIKKRCGTEIQWERMNHAGSGQPVDGPALTHASCNSGIADAIYDPFHKAIWIEGPDATTLRWLKNGWVKTVVGRGSNDDRWNVNGKGTPGTVAAFCWAHVCGFDGKGGVFFYAHSQPLNVWRAYNKEEVKP